MVEFNISTQVDKKSLKNEAFFDPQSEHNWITIADSIKEVVLGPEYNLVINIISKTEITNLNCKWRNKNFPTDILSFPYSSLEGELFLCPSVITERHSEYGRNVGNFVWFLLIHGLHHLKGFDHGKEMELAESKIRNKFNI